MTITLLDLYNECASQPWSMYDNEIDNIDDVEPAMLISLNKAISYVWNLYPWVFRKYSLKIRTRASKPSYSMPDGEIVTKVISGSKRQSVRYEGTYLEYVSDYSILDEQEGEPESFCIDGDNMLIYPTPDDTYIIDVDYYLSPFGVDEEGNRLYELANATDEINIPEKYETYFKNAVISKAMLYAITDQSDENDSGFREQFNDALNVLVKNCYDGGKERKVVI